jgi:phosphatidylserine decarboxylase
MSSIAHVLEERLFRHRETQNFNTGIQEDHHLSDAGYNASADALTEITDEADNHQESPLAPKHPVSKTQHSHAWLESILPASTIENLETQYQLGNYVLDRKTGEKSFETMSIYVRLGMHLLYYGSQQEKALHWQKTLELLEAQSVKMGKQYDAPESKAHIAPFIESFQLQDSMQDMVKPDPEQYSTFNEFFGREIKESARPVDEPENDLVTSRFVFFVE